MKNLVIYGNGRIAKIVYEYVKQSFNVVAFTVDSNLIDEDNLFGVPVVQFDSIAQQFSPDNNSMIVAVGYIDMNDIRAQKTAEAERLGYRFINYVHPSVDIHDGNIEGVNNVILEHVTLQPFAKIGSSNFLWSNSVVAHGSIVGDNNWITSGAVISGDATLGHNNFLGVNSTISHNVTLGDRVFVGANTLVTKPLTDNEVIITGAGEKVRLDSKRFLAFSGV